MIKALFFDLDGTLLTDNKTVSPVTWHTLKRLHERGTKLFIATGRSMDLKKTLNWTDENLALFDGGAFANGGVVRYRDQTEYITLPESSVCSIIDQVSRYSGLHMSLHLTDGKCAFNYSLPERFYGPWGMNQSTIVSLNEQAKAQTVKILIFNENLIDTVTEIPKSLFENLCQSCGSQVNFYLTDQGKTIQAASSKADKKRGVTRLIALAGLADEEVAVFGDDENDIPMLRHFSNSIAMGNAADRVKACARHITLSNNSDGISHAVTCILKLL